jgi:hypothetical protein
MHPFTSIHPSNLEKMASRKQLANQSRIAIVFLVFFCCSVALVASETTPTCQSLGESWYFPNDCVFNCNDLGSTMDTDRSRNVGGNLKCFCVDQAKPFCTDDPYCEDLGIFPGTVQEDCARVCGEDNSAVTATTSVDDNGYQFHYVVNCSCSDGTKKCGEDFVLFSDLDYMKSCTGGDSNSLEIVNDEECDSFCLDTLVFEGGEFATAGQNKTCSCLHSSIISITTADDVNSALACDDATARANDGSGLGNPCYENVGVNQIDCPTASSGAPSPIIAPATASNTAKTLVSSTAIMGVWLLPW